MDKDEVELRPVLTVADLVLKNNLAGADHHHEADITQILYYSVVEKAITFRRFEPSWENFLVTQSMEAVRGLLKITGNERTWQAIYRVFVRWNEVLVQWATVLRKDDSETRPEVDGIHDSSYILI